MAIFQPMAFGSLSIKPLFSVAMCKFLLLGSTAGFVLLAGEQGAFAAAPKAIAPRVDETTDGKSRRPLLRRLWGYTPCPPIRPDCDRNTSVDIGDALPGDFIVSKQTPFRTGRNEVLITSPSTGTEQRFEINLPDTGNFQLYKASFDKVKVSSPEKVLGAGASLSPQQVAAKLQNFEVEFEQNAPKTVVLADGTRGEFSASGVVIRSKDGRVIETVGALAIRGRPRLMAAVPVGSDAVVAQTSGGSCQGSIRNELYRMSQAVQKKGADILKQKATSEEAKLIAWVTTFSRQALEDSLIADNRNQTLQEVACAKPVQCNEPQNYSGGWETRTDLFKLPGGKNSVSLRYQFYQIPDRIELWREGTLVFERGPTSGTDSVEINKSQLHGSGFVGVKLIGNPTNKGTAWNYTISCEGESSLVCDAFDLVKDYRETSSWWNPFTYISYITGFFGINDATEILTGLAAGNLSDCVAASGYDLSEVANVSRGLANAVIAGVEDASVSAACKKIQDKGLSGKPKRPKGANKKKYAGYVAELALYEICGESKSPTSSKRSIKQPVSAELPDGITFSRVNNNTINERLKKREALDAADANKELRKFSDPDEPFHPPFSSGDVIVSQVEKDAYFVRFSGNDAAAEGRYMMRLEDVQTLTIEDIRDKFAIPPNNSMTEMHILQVRPGSEIWSGGVNSHPQWGAGGGQQYLLTGKDPGIEKIWDVKRW